MATAFFSGRWPGRLRALLAGWLMLSMLVVEPAEPRPVTAQVLAPVSRYAAPGPDGRLVYAVDAAGNRLPDFSYAGYRGGGAPLPDVPVGLAVEPGNGQDDDTGRLQAALDTVGRLPADADGWRGALLLKRGRYTLAGSLALTSSGVVLRGEGDGPDGEREGTVLVATGVARTLISVAGQGTWTVTPGTRHLIVDAYVPVGGQTLHLDSVAGLAVGDPIIVQRPTEARWLQAIGMDHFPPRRDGRPVEPWRPGAGLRFDRTIVAIDPGNRAITLDVPLTNALERDYAASLVYKYTFPGRLQQIGIEALRSIAAFSPATDDSRGATPDSYFRATFVQLEAVQDAWVRNITTERYGNGLLNVGERARSITVSDVTDRDALYPAGAIGPPFSFTLHGQLTLVQRCRAERAAHAFATESFTAGPNVFLDCVATAARSDSGPHQRWGSGTLYDNVTVDGHALNVRNRGNLGTGQGWAGANTVLWNCQATRMLVEQPPTAQNWAIGCQSPDRQGDGLYDAVDTPVQPRSLYLAQLQDRLGLPVAAHPAP